MLPPARFPGPLAEAGLDDARHTAATTLLRLGVPARAFAKADDSTALTWTEQGAYLDGIDGADVPVLHKEGGRKRVLGVEDWAEIRRLRRAEQMSISEIARALRVSRNTVRSALARDGAPKYERAPAGSAVDAVEP